MSITGKVVLVTGAGQGIGRGIALRLAHDGADIALVDIDQTKLDALGAPTIVEKSPRRLTAPELLDGTLDLETDPEERTDAEGAASGVALVTADLGDVRARISPSTD